MQTLHCRQSEADCKNSLSTIPKPPNDSKHFESQVIHCQCASKSEFQIDEKGFLNELFFIKITCVVFFCLYAY